jgi:branched-chain amino acid transport system permease protein
VIAQALVDGILGGAIIALGAIGVTFGLAILRFANFSHGELLAVGAYGALVLFSLGLPVALLGAVAAAVLVSLALERLVYRRLRGRGADPLTLVFSSFGLALVLRHLLVLAFGPDPYHYTSEIQMAVRLPAGVVVMPDQVLVFAVVIAALAALWWFLQRTRHGMAMRAVAENPVLASIAGVDLGRTVRLTWAVSAALAALAGVFYGVTVQVRPEMGINLLLALFTAAILGGVGSVVGAVAGAFLISIAENLATLAFPTTYRPIVPFVLLLVALYFRPAGLFAPRR